MKVSIIGIDLAKDTFRVCALNQGNKVLFNRELSHAQLARKVAQLEPTMVAMEACASAHHWGHVFSAMGHQVRLIPPQHVRPFRSKNKTDALDALAICEAARRPNIHPVPIKTVEEQDLHLLNQDRESMIKDRTRLINRARGWLLERGERVPKGATQFCKRVPRLLEDAENNLTDTVRRIIWRLYQQIGSLSEEIERLDIEIESRLAPNEDYQRLLGIGGFGPVVTAVFMAKVGSGQQFQCGRNCAAWAGLTPRLNGTGGNTRTLGITKCGDSSLRVHLIHAARAMYSAAHRRNDALSRWVMALAARRGAGRAIVALANKLARIAWAVLTTKQPYDMNKAFG